MNGLAADRASACLSGFPARVGRCDRRVHASQSDAHQERRRNGLVLKLDRSRARGTLALYFSGSGHGRGHGKHGLECHKLKTFSCHDAVELSYISCSGGDDTDLGFSLTLVELSHTVLMLAT